MVGDDEKENMHFDKRAENTERDKEQDARRKCKLANRSGQLSPSKVFPTALQNGIQKKL